MWKAKSLFFFVGVSVLGSTPLLAQPVPVPAQHCKWLYDHAFTLLAARDFNGMERESNPGDLQLKVSAEVYAMFGPRMALCEEGAYGQFMERYEHYASDALRSNRADRSMRLRAAIAVLQKAPEVVDFAESARETTRFQQARANLRSTAASVGMTPIVRQLLDNIETVGPPKAAQRPGATLPDPHVEKVYAPTVPLPGWAVISIYEIEDHTRRNEMGAIQGKVQAIINWMKSVTPQPAPQ